MATQPMIEEAQMGGDARDFDAEARQQGWKPKEEFPGDPDKWTDAESFVRRAEEQLPLVKKRSEKLASENATLKRDLKQVLQRLDTADKRAYDRAKSEIESRMDAAAEVGDVKTVQKAREQLQNLQEETVTAAKPANDDIAQEAEEAAIEWRAENPWYDKGGLARDYADLMVKKHASEASSMRPAEYFKMIADLVVEKFGDALDTEKPAATARKMLSPVEGGGNRGGRRSGNTFNDLPPEAQKQADRFIRQGLLKDRDAYVKSYQW